MYVIYSRLTAVEVATFNDWSLANARLLELNAGRNDGDPYALRLNA